MNGFIAKNQDFAIETNLADQETWQFLKGIQGLGYIVQLNFFGVSNEEICIQRVKNRVIQGGHFVRPDIVKLRYEAGLKLLRQNRHVPDLLILTDNQHESMNCAELKFGEIKWKKDVLPDWVQFVLSSEVEEPASPSTIEEVREKYKRIKRG